MDSTNKIISFVLGLVVVIVFIVIITGKLNLKKINFLPLAKTSSITPTVTPTPKTTSLSVVNKQVTNSNYKTQTIPATGAPTILLPLAFSGLLGGIYLRKKSNS